MAKELKDLIRMRRKETGKTLEEIALLVGVAKATVQRWESGAIKEIRRDKIVKLALALETTPEYIMGWPEPKWEEDLLEDYWNTHDDNEREEMLRTYGVCKQLYSDWKRIMEKSNKPRTSNSIKLDEHEKQLILAYRKQPQSVKDFISQSLGLSSDASQTKNA